jgi:hypothetical protein
MLSVSRKKAFFIGVYTKNNGNRAVDFLENSMNQMTELTTEEITEVEGGLIFLLALAAFDIGIWAHNAKYL